MKDADKTKQQLLEEIVQLRQQVQSLQQASKTTEAILNKAPILISAKDLKGNVILANERCNLIDNVCNKQFVGNNIHDLFPPNVADAIWEHDLLALSTNDLVETEEAMTHKDKSKHIYYTVIYPLALDDEDNFAVASLSYDITEIKQSLELSITDETTSLYSRRYFNMRFQGELYRANRLQSLFIMLLIDIDHFDSYLEHHGEKRGKDVVTTIAGIIQNVCSRNHDLCFRFTQSSMACLLTVNDANDVHGITEEIRHYVESLSIEHLEAPLHKVITVSIGMSAITHADTLDQLQICDITQAALEKAQSRGGNVICQSQKV